MLAYLHPLWQIGALALAAWVLTLGLRLRRLRRRGAPERVELVDRHARAGIVFVSALAIGAAAGPLTLGLVRDEPVLRSGHAFFAGLTLVPLGFGVWLGWRLWRAGGSPRDRDVHAFCMGLALLLALVTLGLGIELLP